jgi:hypothetical protein
MLLAGCAPVQTPNVRVPNTSTYTAADLYDILHTVDVDLGGDGDLATAAQLRATIVSKSPQGTLNVLRADGGTTLTPPDCARLQSQSPSLSPASIGGIPGATFASFDHNLLTLELVAVSGAKLTPSLASRVDPSELLASCSHMKLELSRHSTLDITLTPAKSTSNADKTWAFDETIVLPDGGAPQSYRFVVAVDGNLVILATASEASEYKRILPDINRIVAAAAMTHQSDS